LSVREIGSALERGEGVARALWSEGLIRAVALHLRGETRTVGMPLQRKIPHASVNDRSLVHA
jgi:hypothetical protein